MHTKESPKKTVAMRNQKCGGCGSEYHVSAGIEVQRSRCWQCGAVAMTDELERNWNLSKNFPAPEPGTVIPRDTATPPEVQRTFETGATRDIDAGKLDYDGFFDPNVILAFAAYMQINRTQADGTMRDSDNWQKGIPKGVYIKSGWRHFFKMWHMFRSFILPKRQPPAGEEMEAICGLLFNTMGYLHERMKDDGHHTWLAREIAGLQILRAEELQERRDNAKAQ